MADHLLRTCLFRCQFMDINVFKVGHLRIKSRSWPTNSRIQLLRLQHNQYTKHNEINISNVTYEIDNWSNVTQKIISHVGQNLHLQDFHPLSLLRQRIVKYFYKRFQNKRGNSLFSVCDSLPPVVTVAQNFDQLLVPKDHPIRSRADTYYVNEGHVLRAHTSAHQWDLVKSGLNNFLIIGDVYRRDAVDYSHYPVFHQVEGVRLCTEHELSVKVFDDEGERTVEKQALHTNEAVIMMTQEMKETIEDLVRILFGGGTNMRWVDAYFPFTHPSWELEVYHENNWLEVLGCGIMEHKLLESAGAGDKIGWAVGFGLERLAMRLYEIPDIRLFWSKDSGFLSQFHVSDIDATVKYKPISVYPQCNNDISFWIPDKFMVTDFYDIVRSVGGDSVEQVLLLDKYHHPKKQQESHCYRLVYRHMEKTLTQAEVNLIHKQIENALVEQLNVVIR